MNVSEVNVKQDDGRLTPPITRSNSTKASTVAQTVIESVESKKTADSSRKRKYETAQPQGSNKELKGENGDVTLKFLGQSDSQPLDVAEPVDLGFSSFSQPIEGEVSFKKKRGMNLTIPWRKTPLTKEEAHQLMIENSKIAINEHRKKEGAAVYPPYSEADNQPIDYKVAVRSDTSAQKGRRKTMEDAHFSLDVPGGHIAGIFDGHGGQGVAEAASTLFPKLFSRAMRHTNGHVHKSLEVAAARVQDKVIRDKKLAYVGSTGVVSFIKDNGKIYTATTGDSEVFRYRKDEAGNITATPFSVLRDWSDSGEVERATKLAKSAKEKARVEGWKQQPNPKGRRTLGGGGRTLNLSRAYGDLTYSAVSRQPEITEGQIREGDKLGFFCDGVTDFATQEEVINVMKGFTPSPNSSLAKAVVDHAIHTKKSTDNVTAMFLTVMKKGEK